MKYRPRVISFDALLDHAGSSDCAQRVFTTTDAQFDAAREKIAERATRLETELRIAKQSDQLYYLGRSSLRFLPLTPGQALRVNAALGLEHEPAEFLSPRQRMLAERIDEALEGQAEALDGLACPADLEQLDEYEARLVEQLAK